MTMVIRHAKCRTMFIQALRQLSDIRYMARLTRSGLGLAVVVAVVVLSSGCVRPVITSGSSAQGWVSRAGSQLVLNGRPWQFTGLNIYNANSRDNCWYTMGAPELGEALDASHAGAMRAWFFQSLATTNGQRDWSKFDATLDAARARNVHVVVTLADQWGACEPGEYKDASWYTDRYRTEKPSGLPATYREWVAEIVTRYRNDPTILAWQLVNEPEVMVERYGQCAENASGILRSFVSDVGGLIKSIDSQHLVSVGVIGGGQCGAVYTEYSDLHSLDVVDLCEYHDYGQPRSAIAGDQWNGLGMRLFQCALLGKPLIVGELGIRPLQDLGGAATLAHRAVVVGAKLQATRAAGVAGTMVWNWNSGAQGGSATDNFEVGPGDPVLPILAGQSGRP